MAGKAIVDLKLLTDFLVVLIARENDFMVPSGGTVLHTGDTLLALSDRELYDEVIARHHLSEGKAAG